LLHSGVRLAYGGVLPEQSLACDLERETREIQFSRVESLQDLLKPFYNNLAAAVMGKGKLVCPGQEGRNAVELANVNIP